MSYEALTSTYGYVVGDSNKGISFEILENPRDFDKQKAVSSDLDWDNSFQTIGQFKVFPYGVGNTLPKEVRDIVKNNNEAPGMLKKKVQMQWGKGPKLYRERNIDGMPVIEWIDDTAIMEWLKSWNYKRYLMQVLVDYTYLESYFSMYVPARRSLLGRSFINRLEHVSIDKARLATLNYEFDAEPSHVIVSSKIFGNGRASIENWDSYPLFDIDLPQRYRSVEYVSMPTFGQSHYAIPDILGTLGWLRQSNNIPKIFKAMSDNGISAKYHVTSPMQYWDKKRELIQERCAEDPDKVYSESMLEEYRENLLRQIGKVLSGVENVGKFWHSEVFYDDDLGQLKELGWKITPIDQNIKDFVEAQIKISERAAYAISTGLNINPILANVDSNNRANSGSAQIHAHNNYVATGVDMDEILVTQCINNAIQINFPGTDARIGFYHTVQKREEEVTPSQRHKNLNE